MAHFASGTSMRHCTMGTKLCSVEGCGRQFYGRGWCATHYLRWWHGRPVGGPIEKRRRGICTVEGCDRELRGGGLCDTHYMRRKRGLPLEPTIRTPAPKGSGTIDQKGYRVLRIDGTSTMEHRLFMERQVGRALLPEEEVHHKNGVRHDNRLENLELWSHSQPKGQRVEDKVLWAKELLALYEPEALA